MELLASRGLLMHDRAEARAFLARVGYCRLRAITCFYEDPAASADGMHPFRPGTTLDGVVLLYQFDSAMRMLCLEALERIEVAAKSAIINELSCLHSDAHWYELDEHFQDRDRHRAMLAELDQQIDRERRSEGRIRDYFTHYDHPSRPPAWIAFEVMSFGMVSRLYRNVRRAAERERVAGWFRCPARVLESWLHSLTVVRNHCAHHQRIWNRVFSYDPTSLRHDAPPYFVPGSRLRHRLQLMRFLLDAQGGSDRWLDRVRDCILARPADQHPHMGFAGDAAADLLWR